MLPHATRVVTFRTEIMRCIMGSLIENCWDLLFKAPPGLSSTRYRKIVVNKVPAVVFPPTAKIGIQESFKERPKLFMLYAHGGGYSLGEPLQWATSYERWVVKASSRGFDLVIIAVNYR
jgi:hypothetical protein